MNELSRQLFHIFIGILIILAVILGFGIPFVVCLLISGLIIVLLVRFNYFESITGFVSELTRDHENIPGLGGFTMVLGCLIPLLFFDVEIAIVGIAVLTFGDSASTIFSKYVKTEKLPYSSKSYGGTIAGFVFGFLGALFFINMLGAFLAGFIGSIVESIDEFLDDNLLIPVIVSLFVYFISPVL
jgi:dolichol kinase